MDQSLREQLGAIVPAVEWHEHTASTNLLGLAAAAGGHRGGLLIVADEQSAGRGRRDRSWHAPSGTSVLASLMLRPSLPKAMWPRYSLAAAVAVDDVARAHVGADRVGLKWPNDLLIDGVKAAGLLLETTADAVVIGVGLNVDWRGVARPDGVSATSLADALRGDVDRDQVLVQLARALMARVEQTEEDPDGIVTTYIPRCATLSAEVVAHGVPGHDVPLRGVAVAVTPDGHLRVRDDDGHEVVVSAGDVEHLR